MEQDTQRNKDIPFLGLKKDIETRLRILTSWRKEINTGLQKIACYNNIDEVKDLITYIDDNISKNKKLKVSIFLDEHPEFENGVSDQINSLIIGSIEGLNASAEREFEIIERAMSHLRLDDKNGSVWDLKKVV